MLNRLGAVALCVVLAGCASASTARWVVLPDRNDPDDVIRLVISPATELAEPVRDERAQGMATRFCQDRGHLDATPMGGETEEVILDSEMLTRYFRCE